MRRMIYPNPDMLLFIAEADACAHAVEYVRPPGNTANYLKAMTMTGYVAHPTHGLVASAYTDDTEMSIANALVFTAFGNLLPSLVHDKGLAHVSFIFVHAWLQELDHGGSNVLKYSKPFQRLLKRVLIEHLDPAKRAQLFLELVEQGSDKNGAAMRAAVCGVYPDPQVAMLVAALQASITHHSRDGLFSARLVALMAHYALYEDAPLSELSAYCKLHLTDPEVMIFGHIFDQPWSGAAVERSIQWSVAINTVHAVFDLVTRQTSLMQMLKLAMRWGGDTDSVASIAWGIASARYRTEVLPSFLRDDLEQGSIKTGAVRLCQLGKNLMEKFSS